MVFLSSTISHQISNQEKSRGFVSVQFSSVAQLCLTLCGLPMDYSTLPCPSPTPGVYSNSIESVTPFNRLILCYPLLFLPSIFPSIRVFSNESALRIRWPKYWSFSFSISPSNEYSGLIFFRMDWLDLLTVQGTLKSLLQHHWECISQLSLNIIHGCDLGTARVAFLEMQRS